MNDRIEALLGKIQELELELENDIEKHRDRLQYTVKENRIKFEKAVIQHHRELRVGIVRFIRSSSLIAVLLSPVIYILIIPLLLLDVAVSLYHFIIFPAYGIRKVPREDFIAVDRHQLSYLNGIEKLNCAFCGYANGLLAYTREIAGRSEEYWCPIKHARKTQGQHQRYLGFDEFGDAEAYRDKNK